MKKPDLFFLTALAIVTVIIAFIYVSMQQNYRMNANDPQIQIVRDVADRLEHNRPVTSLAPADTIDLSKSMALFITYYDTNKKPVTSTGYLNGAIPEFPDRVLEYSKSNNEDCITWQPRKNVQLATVVKHVSSPSVAYIAVGRSLREVEIREGKLVRTVLAAWAVCLVLIVTGRIWSYYRNRSKI